MAYLTNDFNTDLDLLPNDKSEHQTQFLNSELCETHGFPQLTISSSIPELDSALVEEPSSGPLFNKKHNFLLSLLDVSTTSPIYSDVWLMGDDNEQDSKENPTISQASPNNFRQSQILIDTYISDYPILEYIAHLSSISLNSSNSPMTDTDFPTVIFQQDDPQGQQNVKPTLQEQQKTIV